MRQSDVISLFTRWAPRKVDVSSIIVTYSDKYNELSNQASENGGLFIAAYIILRELNRKSLKEILAETGIKAPSFRSFNWFLKLYAVLKVSPSDDLTFEDFKEKVLTVFLENQVIREIFCRICAEPEDYISWRGLAKTKIIGIIESVTGIRGGRVMNFYRVFRDFLFDMGLVEKHVVKRFRKITEYKFTASFYKFCRRKCKALGNYFIERNI